MNMVRQVTDSADRTIACAACGTPFVWTVGEQQFFADHGFQPPRRCRPCRRESRELRREQG